MDQPSKDCRVGDWELGRLPVADVVTSSGHLFGDSALGMLIARIGDSREGKLLPHGPEASSNGHGSCL